MRLAYAMTASAGEFGSDGRLFVLGGDFDMITSDMFPLVYPSMTFIVKLLLDPEECGRQHRLRLVLRAPDGVDIMPPSEVSFVPERPASQPYRQPAVGIALGVQGLILPAPGSYEFHLYVDDERVGDSVPLHAALKETSARAADRAVG